MKKTLTIALLLLSTSSLSAEEQRAFNSALKVSTLGLGLDISTSINETFSTRLNLNGATYSDNQSSNGNSFEGDLELFTAGILLDYYPFQNNFRLSTGVYYNGNGFTGTATPTAGTTIVIDGTTYTTADIGSLDSSITFDTVAPYLGIGWGNDANDRGWGFTFDLGVMYHGTGEADLNANLLNTSTITAAQLESNILNEEQNINNDLASFKFYPVVSLGINYSF